MKRSVKILLITLITILLIGGTIVLGIFGLVKLIAIQRNCGWANIDNIEVNAHIDIPKVKSSNCKFIKEENIKIACFQIDTVNVDMNYYRQNNSLTKLDSTSVVQFEDLLLRKSNFDTLKSSSEFYYRVGSKKDRSWQILLNYTTGQLCVFIQY